MGRGVRGAPQPQAQPHAHRPPSSEAWWPSPTKLPPRTLPWSPGRTATSLVQRPSLAWDRPFYKVCALCLWPVCPACHCGVSCTFRNLPGPGDAGSADPERLISGPCSAVPSFQSSTLWGLSLHPLGITVPAGPFSEGRPPWVYLLPLCWASARTPAFRGGSHLL